MRPFAFLFLAGLALHAAPSRVTLQPVDLVGSSFFGFSSSSSGNLLAVGAPLLNGNSGFGQGAVYVYERVGGSGWVQQARIVAPAFDANDDFGISVALEGNVLMIGAPRTASASGRVFEYRLANGVWTLQQILVSPNASDLLFGGALSMNRGRLAVGSGALNVASVYVYTRDAASGNWSAPVRLRSHDTFSVLGFGSSVALLGDTLVVGAPHSSLAYIYGRRNGVWARDAELTAPAEAPGGLFGWSVAVDRGRVAIGAPTGAVEGSVFVYSLVNGVWGPLFRIGAAAAGVANFANFGLSVALLDNTLAVGAPSAAVGTVTTFTINGGNWVLAERFAAATGGPEALFGRTVVLPDNNTTIIASPGWSSSTQQFLGAVDIFQR